MAHHAKFFYFIEKGKVVTWLTGSIVDYDHEEAVLLPVTASNPKVLGVDEKGKLIKETLAQRDARIEAMRTAKVAKLEAEKASRQNDESVTENRAKAWVAEDPANRSFLIKDAPVAQVSAKFLVFEAGDVREMTADEKKAVEKDEKDADKAEKQAKKNRRKAIKQKLKALNFDDHEVEEVLGGKD
ncbi:MAG: hypothetical protein MOGMAGMI_02341 [Candidatus Omnitrophica bacterium]|nr:hypothetical protein [Candidatus Omnitrophota bacterium]